MIITALFTLLIGAIDKLPQLEFDFNSITLQLETALQYFLAGLNAFVALIGRQTCSILVAYLGIILLLNGIYLSYQMIWWFIKKIPMIDVDQ